MPKHGGRGVGPLGKRGASDMEREDTRGSNKRQKPAVEHPIALLKGAAEEPQDKRYNLRHVSSTSVFPHPTPCPGFLLSGHAFAFPPVVSVSNQNPSTAAPQRHDDRNPRLCTQPAHDSSSPTQSHPRGDDDVGLFEKEVCHGCNAAPHFAGESHSGRQRGAAEDPPRP